MSSYDQNLLDEAPRATRAQLQEGYNVDLLEQPPPRRTPSMRTPAPQIPQPVAVPLTPGIAETGPEEKFTYTSAAPTSKPSFWRSRNGVIAVLLIVLIVIGAVVGGAVGGTLKSNNNNAHAPTSANTSLPITQLSVATSTSSTSSVTQAIGGNPTSRPLVASSTSGVEGPSTTTAAGGVNIQVEVPNTITQGVAT